MTKFIFALFKSFIPLATVFTVVVLAICVAIQAEMRQSANDPQVQMTEDAATALFGGQLPQSLIPQESIDISKSLAPFMIIYNEMGQPLASSADLNGQVPTVPQGVFEYVNLHGEDRITWEPADGVRSAIVVRSFRNKDSTGYVLAGRSLREVEKRKDQLFRNLFLAWGAGLVGIAAVVIIVEITNKAVSSRLEKLS